MADATRCGLEWCATIELIRFTSLTLLACSKGQPELTAEDLAGEHFAAGAKVMAPLGKRKKRHATVVEVYGKVAKLNFGDNVGWALLKEIDPQGAVSHFPNGDSCSAAVGDHVLARWSTSLSLTAAVVDEVYGKLAHLHFADGDVDWAVCADLKRVKAPTTKARNTSTERLQPSRSASVPATTNATALRTSRSVSATAAGPVTADSRW